MRGVEVRCVLLSIAAAGAGEADQTVRASVAPALVATELPTLGGASSLAFGLAPDGRVVGSAEDADGRERAVLWADGLPTDLGTLGGVEARATGIDDGGRIVGLSTTGPGQELGGPGTRGFLWDGRSMRELGAVPGFGASGAADVNAHGAAVGAAWGDDLVGPALLWVGDEVLVLATLGGERAGATAVNDEGWVVGQAETDNGSARAVLWRDGRVLDPGALGGDGSIAFDINPAGLVVGSADNRDGLRTAFVWTDGRMEALESRGFAESLAGGVNARGDAVGWARSAEGRESAVLWRNGVLFDLLRGLPAGSGWSGPGNATAINDRGQIAGFGTRGDHTRAFLLTPDAGSAPFASPELAPDRGEEATGAGRPHISAPPVRTVPAW